MREGIKGRFYSFKKLKAFSVKNIKSKNVYWFHAASLGEFFQIEPIIKGIKKAGENNQIIVSFSSPSGINNVSNNFIDLKIYLPFDFPWTAQKILTLVKPKKIIFASYDIWPNFLWACKIKNIHLSIISAKIQRSSAKFSPVLRSFYQNLYRLFDTIYTITEDDIILFKELIGAKKIPIMSPMGNPRFDMIYNEFKHKKIIKNPISKRSQVILIGSSHSEDDLILIPALINLFKNFPKLRVIHAPHEPSKSQIKNLTKNYANYGLKPVILKDYESILSSTKKIIIVGEVGFLSDLYWLSLISYVGGGFSSGLHNIMEPAIASNPIVFGPRYHKFVEAKQSINLGGGFCAHDSIKLENVMEKLLSNKSLLLKSSKASFKLIEMNIGASKRIIDGLLFD